MTASDHPAGRREHRTAARTLTFTVAGTVGLLWLVAASARRSTSSPIDSIGENVSWVVAFGATIISLLLVVGAVGLLYAFWPQELRRRRHTDEEPLLVQDEPPPAPWWSKVVVVVAPFLLIGLVLAAALSIHTSSRAGHGSTGEPVYQTRTTATVPDRGHASETSRSAQEAAIDRWVVGGTVVAALAAGCVLIIRDRTPRRPDQLDTPGRRVEAVAAIDESLAALRMEPDCRRAVIAAYARMERWLAVAGMARAPSEGPGEFVERVVNLGGPAPAATTLTKLFQEAKFSRHPVDSTMKQRALDALIDLRSALARRP